MALDTSYTSRNIADIFYTLRKDATLNGAVPCDGREYNLSDFESNSTHDLATLISESMISVMSYTDYASQVESYGSCAYFAYDENTGKFKVPTIKNAYVQLMASGTPLTEGNPDPVGLIVDDYKVPYIFVPGTEAKATEVNANFDYVLRALEDLSDSSDVVHLGGTETITGEKTFTVAPKLKGLELTGGPVDFHYGGSAADYTARLFEAVQGYLAINQNPPLEDSSTKIATTNWVNSKVSSSSIIGDIANWIRLPNGTIIQYGMRTGLGFWGGWSWSNFPTTFPNACRAVAVSWTYVQGAGNKGSTCGVQFNNSVIGVYPRFEQGAANLSYIAIGF